MKIKKALIPAAGFGTRFFPITKTIQKEMLPILSRPLIDYVVEDCIKAGVEEIVFVIKPTDTQIKDFYSESESMKSYLKRMKKMEKYEKIKDLHTKAKFNFVFQTDKDPYGTATPIKLAKDYVKDEDAFLVFMGDDFIFNRDGSSEAKKMIENFSSGDYVGLANFVPKPAEEIEKYGVAKYREEKGKKLLEDIVEKPKREEAPSNLANISKYIFTPEIFEILDRQKINEKRGELEITDSLFGLLEKGDVVIHEPEGEYLDGGDVWLWLKANLVVAMEDEELKGKLMEFF